MDETAIKPYGTDDASYQAAGGEAGIQQLVSDFYRIMDTDPVAKTIRNMHPKDISTSDDKLWRFLSGWLGGPNRYNETYGGISIPQAHATFPIGEAERDAWLHCMQQAVDLQPYAEDFKQYLMTQLAVPANRILNTCQMTQAAGG